MRRSRGIENMGRSLVPVAVVASAKRDNGASAQEGALALIRRKIEAGKLKDAENLLRKRLKRHPNDPAALKLSGDCARGKGNRDAALTAYESALKASPGFAPACFAAGTLLEEGGLVDPAAGLYRQAIDSDPDFAEPLFQLGQLLRGQGRLQEARDCYAKGVMLLPDFTPGLVNLGNLALALGHPSEAETCYRKALELSPGLPVALCNLALALRALGRLSEALEAAQQVLDLQPQNAEALSALGSIQKALGEIQAGLENCRAAVALNPRSAEYHFNLGDALRSVDDLAGAAESYKTAIRLNPSLTVAYNNLAVIREEQGNAAEAVRLWESALKYDPENAGFKTSLSRAYLSCGELAKSLDYGEAGFAAGLRKPDRKIPLPRWEGEILAGRRLLVWREQGLGDEIRFASCYPDLLKHGGNCTIECDPRLVSIFCRSFPSAQIRPETKDDGAAAQGADLQIPAGSLPRLFRRTYDSYPAQRYLEADPVLVEKWRARLAAACEGRKVGICWRSGLITRERSRHYPSLRDWADLLRLSGFTFVCLQYGDCNEEIAAVESDFGLRIHRWNDLDLKDDLEQVLALIESLDLVVTASTAVADMAGALGKDTWRLYASATHPNAESRESWYGVHALGRHWQQDWRGVLSYLAARLALP